MVLVLCYNKNNVAHAMARAPAGLHLNVILDFFHIKLVFNLIVFYIYYILPIDLLDHDTKLPGYASQPQSALACLTFPFYFRVSLYIMNYTYRTMAFVLKAEWHVYVINKLSR